VAERDDRDLATRIQQSLTRSALSRRDVDVIGVCDLTEDRLSALALEAFVETLRLALAEVGRRVVTTPTDLLIVEQVAYRTRLAVDIAAESTLHMILEKVSLPQQEDVLVEFLELDSLGRYLRVALHVPREFEDYIRDLATVVRVVYESGYRWLAEFVRASLRDLQSRSGEDLYSQIRLILPPKVAERVWLYVVADGQGIYVPCETNREMLFSLASDRVLPRNETPLRVVSAFCTEVLEYAGLFAKIAIEQDRTIESDLANPDYSPKKPMRGSLNC